MKTLMLASLLLLAVPVGAEMSLIDSVYLEEMQCAISKEMVNGNINAYCSNAAVKKKEPWYVVNINTHPDPCLTKMEAAMRAIEPWIRMLGNENDKQTKLITATQAVEYLWKWDEIKRECWKEKP